MDPHHAFDVNLDVCGRCAGIWFDDEELKHLQAAGSGAMTQLDAQFTPQMERSHRDSPTKLCPVCPDGVAMEEYTYMYASPVNIDACPACHGIWVEEGELTIMENLIRQSKDEPISAKEYHAIGAAEEMAKHETFMGKQRWLRGVLRIMTLRRPYWP